MEEVRERMLMACVKEGSKESRLMEGRLISGNIKRFLKGEIEDGEGNKKNIGEAITEKYISGLLDPNEKITTKDMLGLQKLLGEDRVIDGSEEGRDVKKKNGTDTFLEGIVSKDGE